MSVFNGVAAQSQVPSRVSNVSPEHELDLFLESLERSPLSNPDNI